MKSSDRFQVTFDNSELGNPSPDFYIYLKAEPSGGGGNLSNIDCLMYAVQTASDVSTWTGTLLETDTSSHDYDFYNYVISGSGQGTVTIMWDTNYFKINPYFVTVNGGTTGTVSGGTYDGWDKVTLSVDSTKKNRFEMQLYKVNSNMSYTGSNAASNYITYSFSPN